jgi:sulfonate transport system substrate-binding protein
MNTSRERPRRRPCRCSKVNHKLRVDSFCTVHRGGKLNNQKRQELALVIAVLIVAAMLPGCSRKASAKPTIIKLDYAYYNPLSLVLKEKKFLEKDLASDGISVEWTQSLGSNKALQLLNSKSVDFGSTAGAAALIGKANGNPIKAIYVYSRPEWTALVVRKDSSITKIEDLKGKKVAVTHGTDPHIFLLRALHEAGLTEKDVEMVVLQHPEGRIALEKGDVDAWAGLDPMMAQTEIQSGSRLFYRNVNFNSYGVLDVREEFAKQYPAYVKHVLAAYEKARLWALQNPEEFRKLLATDTKLDDSVITKVLERTDLSNSTIGDNQRQVIVAAGDVLKQNNVINSSTDVSATVNNLIDPRYAQDVVNKSVTKK